MHSCQLIHKPSVFPGNLRIYEGTTVQYLRSVAKHWCAHISMPYCTYIHPMYVRMYVFCVCVRAYVHDMTILYSNTVMYSIFIHLYGTIRAIYNQFWNETIQSVADCNVRTC